MRHIDGPRGEGAGNDGEVGVDAVLALALHLGLVEGAARDGGLPGHLLLGAEGSVRRNRDRIHLLGGRVTVSGALLTADLRLELGAGPRAAVCASDGLEHAGRKSLKEIWLGLGMRLTYFS